VQRLVETGELTSTGRVGRSLLVDSNSVNRLRANGAQRGRPWNQRTVWVAIDLLSGKTSQELTSSQRWHVRNRLRQMTTADLVRLGRRRASVHRYRVSESFLANLRNELVVTGASALDANVGLASEFRLAGRGKAGVDGYVAKDQLGRIVAAYLMVEDESGNVVLRVVDDRSRVGDGGSAATAVIALDLAESLDPRERSAGRRVLDRMLRQL
jgi:hypothetical protein